MIVVKNSLTGEVMEFADEDEAQLRMSWEMISAQEKALERAKNQLKNKVEKILTENDTYNFDDAEFKRIYVQRKNYDKVVMREVLEPDVFDVLIKPDKTKVDEYLKENIESLGQASTVLRNSMIDEGKPFSFIRLNYLTDVKKSY